MPKIDCHVAVSSVNQVLKRKRRFLAAKADREDKKRSEKEMIEKVKASLFRKDSTVELMEKFVKSLNQGENVNETPEENYKSDLFSIEDSLRPNEFGNQSEKGTARPRFDNGEVDKELLETIQKIRLSNGWVNPALELDIEDFDGDEKALSEARLLHGPQIIEQDEKMLLFEFMKRKLDK